MYKLLIADDEGIMLEALRNIITQTFGDECEIRTAKSGRAAIELAESFRPDIIFMDIQMPGINGIQAINEIRKFHSTVLCYVISAYDKFDYAKEAISLGVEKYLMKPIAKKTVLAVMEEAMKKVDTMRKQRSDRLKIQEKLETIIPVVESGLVSCILTQSDWKDAEYYMQLLDVKEQYGYAMVIQIGTDYQEGKLVSPVGLGVKAQGMLPEISAIVKSYFHCIVGAVMVNRITVIIPYEKEVMDYEERIVLIEDTRSMVLRMEERIDAKFRVGIGRPRRTGKLRNSYQEAIQALEESHSRVIHMDDIQKHGVYDGEFPVETEENMFRFNIQGDIDAMRREANSFYDWMVSHYPANQNTIRLKILEFVMVAEKDAFHVGAVDYGFEYRKDYLGDVMALEDYEQLRHWFLDKMTSICERIRNKQEEQSESVVDKAQNYILENYTKEISLDDVSKEVNVSPYYFSKLFKEETGENFIEYLTKLRVDHAKELLKKQEISVKEISVMCGYSDPNYFSRLFKKQTDMTPREYREKFGNSRENG